MHASSLRLLLLGALTLPLTATAASTDASEADRTDDAPVYGPRLEGFAYPHDVEIYRFESQRQPLEMAYMDVAPQGKANGRTAVLLHGKNFCGATWEGTIEALTARGYRVIAPDQIGFCKSSKPEHYQYSLHQLAANTHALLKQRGIEHATIMGHSMGGMLATRYALMYPRSTDRLVLVDPIGLEDWKAKGVPYHTVDQWFEITRKANADSMRKYQQNTYYAGTWKPEYDRWVQMQAGMYRGDGRFINAWSQAKTYEMIYTQPIVYEFDQLKVPTLLMIGDQDNTAIGKAFAPAEVQKTLGHYDQLGPKIASRIPDSLLIQFPELGHSPQIQAPEKFHQALFRGLDELDHS